MNIPKKIQTERLTFYPVSTAQLPEFYDAFTESFDSLKQYYIPLWSRLDTLPSKSDMSDFLKDNENNFTTKEGFFFSVYDHENHFIGQAELHHIDWSVPKARLGYWVRNNQRGKGYATEMANMLTQFGFDRLKCQRLEIRNDVRNPASGVIAKKLGYKFLTIFEKNKQGKEGDFWDLEIYARLNTKNLPPLKVTYYDES